MQFRYYLERKKKRDRVPFLGSFLLPYEKKLKCYIKRPSYSLIIADDFGGATGAVRGIERSPTNVGIGGTVSHNRQQCYTISLIINTPLNGAFGGINGTDGITRVF